MKSCGVNELFVPRYRAAASGRWRLDVQPLGFHPGYWSGPVLAENTAILSRDQAVWMAISPLEIESQGIGLCLARGHVVIAGLGLGWAAAAAAALPQVAAVTVLERDPEVLALHAEIDVFAQLAPDQRAKLTLVEADALAWRPAAPVDTLLADIWRPLVSEGRLGEVRRMHANIAPSAIHFWGQELEIARHARAAGRALDQPGIAATIAGFALPLLGPDLADYPEKLAAAADRHMGSQWF